MEIKNTGTSSGLVATIYEYWPDQDPAMPGWAPTPPGGVFGPYGNPSGPSNACWVFHAKYPRVSPRLPFWKGRADNGDTVFANPDNGEVSINSNLVQSNVDGKICGQVTHGPTFGYMVGNRAAMPNGMSVKVEPNTPYLLIERRPIPGSTFGLSTGITVKGPMTTVTGPKIADNIVAYCDAAGHLVSVMIMSPNPGIWTGTVNPGGADNEDGAWFAITGPQDADMGVMEKAIGNASAISISAIDCLVPGLTGQSLRAEGLSVSHNIDAQARAVPYGACPLCIVTWMIPMGIIGAYTAAQLGIPATLSAVSTRVAGITGIGYGIISELLSETGIETNPLKWPRLFCRKMGECETPPEQESA